MKHHFLVLLILIGSNFCKAQSVILPLELPKGAVVNSSAPLIVPATDMIAKSTPIPHEISIPIPSFTAGVAITNFKSYSGYQKSNTIDTVEVYLLVGSRTQGKGYFAEPTAMLYGFAIRRLMIFRGDAMPPFNYDPYWEVESYLDADRRKFPNNVIIWQAKIK